MTNYETGAGKSTAIRFLLDGQLFEDTQHFPPVWREDSDLDQGAEFPKIGHQLGSSETSYLKGYPLGSSTLLCDTAGLDDTRGPHYELATRLSVTRAIKLANSTKIVVTIPLHSFYEGKGQNVYKLLNKVKDWIPNIFQSEANGGLFILITKHGNNNERDFDDILNQLASSKNADTERNHLWAILKSLNKVGKINFVHLNDFQNREQIYKSYFNSNGLIKNELSSDNHLNTNEELLKIIQMAAGTWTDLIQRHSLTLPFTINKLDQDIKNRQQEIENSKKLIEDYAKEIEQLEKQPETASQKSIPLPNYDKCLETLKTYETQYNEAQKNEEAATKTIIELKNNLKYYSAEIKNLSMKSEETIIKTFQPTLAGSITLCLNNGGLVQRLFEEFRALNKNDCTGYETANHNTYIGKIGHTFKVSKDYWLVPENQDQRELFLANNLVVIGDRKYQMRFSGMSSAIDRSKVHSDGKQIMYHVITEWKDERSYLSRIGESFKRNNPEELPWFTIIHDLPGDVVHEATIKNLLALKERDSEELKQQEKNLIIQRGFVAHYQTLYNQHKPLCDKDRLTDIEEAVSSRKTLIEGLGTLNSSLFSTNEKEVKDLAKARNAKEMLDIVFQTRSETLAALSTFCHLIGTSEQSPDLIKSCGEFQKIYQHTI